MEEALSLERSLPDWPIEEGPAFVSSHQLLWSGEAERGSVLLRELERALGSRGEVAPARHTRSAGPHPGAGRELGGRRPLRDRCPWR